MALNSVQKIILDAYYAYARKRQGGAATANKDECKRAVDQLAALMARLKERPEPLKSEEIDTIHGQLEVIKSLSHTGWGSSKGKTSTLLNQLKIVLLTAKTYEEIEVKVNPTQKKVVIPVIPKSISEKKSLELQIQAVATTNLDETLARAITLASTFVNPLVVSTTAAASRAGIATPSDYEDTAASPTAITALYSLKPAPAQLKVAAPAAVATSTDSVDSKESNELDYDRQPCLVYNNLFEEIGTRSKASKQFLKEAYSLLRVYDLSLESVPDFDDLTTNEASWEIIRDFIIAAQKNPTPPLEDTEWLARLLDYTYEQIFSIPEIAVAYKSYAVHVEDSDFDQESKEALLKQVYDDLKAYKRHLLENVSETTDSMIIEAAWERIRVCLAANYEEDWAAEFAKEARTAMDPRVLRRKLANKNSEITSLQDSVKILEDSLADTQGVLITQSREISSLKAQIAELQAEIASLKAAASKHAAGASSGATTMPARTNMAAMLAQRKPFGGDETAKTVAASALAPIAAAGAGTATPTPEMIKARLETMGRLPTENEDHIDSEKLTSLLAKVDKIITKYATRRDEALSFLFSLNNTSLQSAISYLGMDMPERPGQADKLTTAIGDTSKYVRADIPSISVPAAAPASTPEMIKGRLDAMGQLPAENEDHIDTESLTSYLGKLDKIITKYADRRAEVLSFLSSLNNSSLKSAISHLGMDMPPRPGQADKLTTAITDTTKYTRLAPTTSASSPATAGRSGLLSGITGGTSGLRKAETAVSASALSLKDMEDRLKAMSRLQTTHADHLNATSLAALISQNDEVAKKYSKRLIEVAAFLKVLEDESLRRAIAVLATEPAGYFDTLKADHSYKKLLWEMTTPERIARMQELPAKDENHIAGEEAIQFTGYYNLMLEKYSGAKQAEVINFLKELEDESLQRAIKGLGTNDATYFASEIKENRDKYLKVLSPHKPLKAEATLSYSAVLRVNYKNRRLAKSDGASAAGTIDPLTGRQDFSSQTAAKRAGFASAVAGVKQPPKAELVIAGLIPSLNAQIGINPIKAVLVAKQAQIVTCNSRVNPDTTRVKGEKLASLQANHAKYAADLAARQAELVQLKTLFSLQTQPTILTILEDLRAGATLENLFKEYPPKITPAEYQLLEKYCQEHAELSASQVFKFLSGLTADELHTALVRLETETFEVIAASMGTRITGIASPEGEPTKTDVAAKPAHAPGAKHASTRVMAAIASPLGAQGGATLNSPSGVVRRLSLTKTPAQLLARHEEDTWDSNDSDDEASIPRLMDPSTAFAHKALAGAPQGPKATQAKIGAVFASALGASVTSDTAADAGAPAPGRNSLF